MNKGLFKLGTRELDCADLPAQNGIVQTLGTLCHRVHICSVSPCQTSLEKTKQYIVSERKKMWTRCPLVPEN